MTPVKDHKTTVKQERVETENYTVESHLLFMESDSHSQQSVEENDDNEENRVGDKDQAGQKEVGLTEMPLLEDVSRQQIP